MTLGLNRYHRVIGQFFVIHHRLIQLCIGFLIIIIDQLLQCRAFAKHHYALGILRIFKRNRERLIPYDGLRLGDPASNPAKAIVPYLQPVIVALVNIKHAERNDVTGFRAGVRLFIESRIRNRQHALVQRFFTLHQQRLLHRPKLSRQ